jgi:arylsulfatase A-like enzyme
MSFQKLILLTLFSALCACQSSQVHSNPRPNVIIVITDDQGYGDVAANGHPYLKTPEIDNLRSESLRLENFHVDPTCSPTRSALMTGRYSARVGVWHTILGRSLLRKNEITMADIFKDNDYATGMFGKWHLGDNYPYRPQDRGFSHVVYHKGGGVGQGPDYWDNNYFDDTYFVNGKEKKFKGYCTEVWFDEAMKFIETNKKKPFFCYLATNAPHGPFLVAPKYSQPYKAKGKSKGKRNPANFLGMVTNIDENLGRLKAKLKELNLEKNTILIFMTDNGSSAGWQTYNAGMRAGKGSEYDGGHRVPFYIRWPNGKLPQNKDIKTLTAHVDILPTLVDLCNLKAKTVDYDGQSLKKLFYNSKDTALDNRSLIVESQRIYQPVKWRKCAVMTDKWRLVNGQELYDIRNDIGQKNDLAAKHPAIVTKLRKSYEKNWASLAAYSHRQYSYISIGSQYENPTALMSHDTLVDGTMVAWSQGHVKRGSTYKDPFWSIYVEEDGVYSFDMRRWPKEANQTINAKFVGKAVEASAAVLSIADFKETKKVKEEDKGVVFTATLKKGKYQLRGNFICPDGLRGAYYIYVKKH